MQAGQRNVRRLAQTMLFSVALLLAGHGQTLGDDAAETALSAHLTGGDERPWVKTRWEPVLSLEAAQCAGGEIWTFAQRGEGARTICDGGSAREETFEWRFLRSESGLPVISVDGKEYVVERRQKKSELEGEPPILVTILRSLRTDQAEPVEEITLEFWER